MVICTLLFLPLTADSRKQSLYIWFFVLRYIISFYKLDCIGTLMYSFCIPCMTLPNSLDKLCLHILSISISFSNDSFLSSSKMWQIFSLFRCWICWDGNGSVCIEFLEYSWFSNVSDFENLLCCCGKWRRWFYTLVDFIWFEYWNRIEQSLTCSKCFCFCHIAQSLNNSF